MNYVLRDEKAIAFECGFGCDNGLFVNVDGKKYLLSDSRYTIDAKLNIYKDVEFIESPDLFKSACDLIAGKKVIIDPFDLKLGEFEALKESKAQFEYKKNFSKYKRTVKSKEELDFIRKSAALNIEAFNEFASYLEREGLNKTELELYNMAKFIWGSKGEVSFEPIIAINENAAKAHARPSDKRLQYGDILLVDAGTTYKGYASDRTRVLGFNEGKLSFDKPHFADQKIDKAYKAIKKAHDEAIAFIKLGIPCKAIDEKAREVLKELGMDKYFTHSLGHGVGLNIHEFPVIGVKGDQCVEANVAFTIEPGLYFEGEFGVRYEDIVIVHEDGKVEIL